MFRTKRDFSSPSGSSVILDSPTLPSAFGAYAFDSITEEAVSLLTGQQKDLAEHLATLLRQAAAVEIPDSRVAVDTYQEIETGRVLLRITQVVTTSPETALSYWERAGVVVEEWIASLPEDQAEIVHEAFLTRLKWDENEPAR